MDFLFPDNNYAKKPLCSIDRYTNYLEDVFDEWVNDNNPSIQIRKFRSIIMQLLGQKSLIYGFGSYKSKIPLLCIRSDGDISPTDELMSTDLDTVFNTKTNVKNSTLRDVLNQPIFKEIDDAVTNAPFECSKCCWYHACGAGSLVSRFSTEKRFHNASVYCDSFKNIFSKISSYMISYGVDESQITQTLFKN